MKLLRFLLLVALVAGGLSLTAIGQETPKDAPKDTPKDAPKVDVPAGFQAFIVYEPRFKGGVSPKEVAAKGFKAYIEYDQIAEALRPDGRLLIDKEPMEAQDPDKPAKNTDIRNRTGCLFDLVSEHGLHPVVAVYSRTTPTGDVASSSVAAILAKQDTLATNYYHRRLGTFTVFLGLKNTFRDDENRDARLKEVAQFAIGTTPKRTTLGLAEGVIQPKDEAPRVPKQVAELKLADTDDVLVVLYYRLTEVKRWKLAAGESVGTKLDELEAEVVKLLGPPKPPVVVKE